MGTDGPKTTKEDRMGNKSKRGRGWGADGKLKDLPNAGHMANAEGKFDKDKLERMTDWLYQYARDMHSWGQDVRDDIIRLEGRAGFAAGDPGDPPDGPPNGDDDESTNGDN